MYFNKNKTQIIIRDFAYNNGNDIIIKNIENKWYNNNKMLKLINKVKKIKYFKNPNVIGQINFKNRIYN